jgi:hypothetical protein
VLRTISTGSTTSTSVKMTTLHLITFKSSSIAPKATAHWALFLPDKQGGSIGILFAVKKRSLTSAKTEFQMYEHYDANSSDVQSTHALPEIVVSSSVLSSACHEVTYNRAFHFINSNCQHWVLEVIEELSRREIVDGNHVLERLKKLGFSPLGGYSKGWGRNFKQEV